MSYFVDPYKKYYEALNKSNDLSSAVSSMSETIVESKDIITRINYTISESSWKELGIKQLSDNVVPNVLSQTNILMNNISNVLEPIANKISELLNELKKLKEEDELCENNRSAYNAFVTSYYNKEQDNYYVSRKNELYNSYNESKRKCEEYIRNCNTIVLSIKTLDSSVEEFKEEIKTETSNSNKSYSIIESVDNGKMLRVTYNGSEYFIVNTKINCMEYEKYVQKNGLTQNSGLLGSQCMLLSQYYAMDMMRGTWTDRSTMANYGASPATRINDYVKSPTKDEVLEYIYNEALQGRPTVLQVTQRLSYKGLRHLVTVVGFDSSVKSAQDLTADKIFVLDCVDGKLQRLTEKERDLFNQGGYYFARGATQEFLAKEVTRPSSVSA